MIRVNTYAYGSGNYEADSGNIALQDAYAVLGEKEKVDAYFHDYYQFVNDIDEGNLSKVKQWVSKMGVEAKVSYRGYFHSPLVHAVRNNHLKIVQYLLEEGADPNRYMDVDNSRSTALMDVAIGEDEKMVALLLEYGADANAVDRCGMSALFYTLGFSGVTGSKNKNIIRMLLPLTDLNRPTTKDVYLYPSSATLLTLAFEHDSSNQILDMLIDAGAGAGSSDASKEEFLEIFIKVAKFKDYNMVYRYSKIAFELVEESHQRKVEQLMIYLLSTLYESAMVTKHHLNKKEQKRFTALAEKYPKAKAYVTMFRIIEDSQSSMQSRQIEKWHKKYAKLIQNEWCFDVLKWWANQLDKKRYPHVMKSILTFEKMVRSR